MVKINKEYIEKEYNQAVKEYNATRQSQKMIWILPDVQ